MKPPICAICMVKFDPINTGGLIHFKLRQSDKEWRERMDKIHGTGHPPESAWFCEKHFPRAKELSDLTIDKAFQQLREDFSTN
jgi:hypothetical protein